MKPLLLDLFCGAGGAAMGYHRAGFDVVGVDINPQPNYPFEFVQADVLVYLDEWIMALEQHGDEAIGDTTAIHASPPCQKFSFSTRFHPGVSASHDDLITPTRELLSFLGFPFVIENVAGAPLRKDLMLCGEMFSLRLHRHRYFEIENWALEWKPQHRKHYLRGARHNCDLRPGHARLVAGNYSDHPSACRAMGINWMTRKELSEAIPPAYTEFIGHQLMAHIQEVK